VIESPSDESNSIDNASAEGENVIYAPSDESGPQPIDKPSDESGPQPITQTQMTSQERHLRHLLGYDDEEVG